jgi:hypothetical protein
MTPRNKGLLIVAVQLAIVLSLGVKLLYDRATLPRVWVQCETYDPSLPIRGRYLAENLRMAAKGFDYTAPTPPNAYTFYGNVRWAHLEVENGQLVAEKMGTGRGIWVQLRKEATGALVAVTQEPVLLFIPEDARIPTLARGEEMWVEVTVPSKGPPRPIRMGIKKNGAIAPIHFE